MNDEITNPFENQRTGALKWTVVVLVHWTNSWQYTAILTPRLYWTCSERQQVLILTKSSLV